MLANSQPPFLPQVQDRAVAWLFPGQGTQEPGMGRDLWEGSPAARRVFETADRVLDYPLTTLCFEGPVERLRDTRFAQPAVFTVSLAALAAAIEADSLSARPAFTAGHSLGEYTALVAAGALTLVDGLLLLQERARLTAGAAAAQPGSLAAIIGLDEATVQAICTQVDVDLCNLNLPAQTVIGGDRDAVARAMALARERGAQRVVELNVTGAFHSRLMQPAVPGLAEALAQAPLTAPAVPVVANVSAQALLSAEAVREELAVQIVRPVRWHESLSLMTAAGVTTFIEFGPGRVLTGLARRALPGAALINVATLAEATSPVDALPVGK